MSLITGIHHAAMRCGSTAQFEEECRFYGEILELPLIKKSEAMATFDTGSGIIELFAEGIKLTETGAINHFALETIDVDACVEKVRAAGYAITVEPKEVVTSVEPPHSTRLAFCRGPIGEDIEFVCLK